MSADGENADNERNAPADASAPPPNAVPSADARAGEAGSVRIDDRHVKSSYCNVCNATSTGEEVVLNFGLNRAWERRDGLDIELHHQVIMTPHAVKRLRTLLTDLLDEHERRYGPLRE